MIYYLCNKNLPIHKKTLLFTYIYLISAIKTFCPFFLKEKNNTHTLLHTSLARCAHQLSASSRGSRQIGGCQSRHRISFIILFFFEREREYI